MATPHVAGLVAYLINKDGNTSPTAMVTKLYNLSLKNVLSYIRTCYLYFNEVCRVTFILAPGTINCLARNDQ